MNNKLSLALFLIFVCRLSAQIEVTSGGNVGIGTAGSSEKLTVWGNILVGNSAISAGVHALTPTGWGYSPNFYRVVMVGAASGNETVSIGYDPSGNPDATFSGHGQEVLFRRGVQFVTPNAANTGFNLSNLVLLDGNVGIGTNSPAAPLHVYHASQPQIRLQSANRQWGIVSNTSWGNNGFSIYDFTADDTRLQIDTTGKVGIGTISPTHRLQVVGAVRASSFVSDTATYADFVFKPGYKLPSLTDVEAAIQRDGHLPGIPSEAEAKEHGIDLGAMQVKLLQKVEELTLHAIAQQKEIAVLRQELAALKNH